MTVEACILAGGRASRLGGVAKPLVEVGGRTILARQLDVLTPRVASVIVALAPGAAPPPVPAAWAGRVRFVHDVAEGAGPLAGLAAGLAAARAPWLLAVAGDLPDLAPALVDLLIAACAAAGDADAVVPRVGGHPEPLLAAYAVTVDDTVNVRISDGRRSVQGLLGALRVRWIEEAALRAVDPALRSFQDLDTPEDLVRWQTDRSGV